MKRMIAFLLAFLLAFPAVCALSESAVPADTIEAAVERFLTAEMERQATITASEWERYLYAQGVSDITFNLEKFDVAKGKPLAVAFRMADGQPDVKNQPSYQDDPVPFLQGVVQSMRTRNATVKLNLMITEQGGYLADYAKGGEAALQKKEGNTSTSDIDFGDWNKP